MPNPASKDPPSRKRRTPAHNQLFSANQPVCTYENPLARPCPTARAISNNCASPPQPRPQPPLPMSPKGEGCGWGRGGLDSLKGSRVSVPRLNLASGLQSTACASAVNTKRLGGGVQIGCALQRFEASAVFLWGSPKKGH